MLEFLVWLPCAEVNNFSEADMGEGTVAEMSSTVRVPFRKRMILCDNPPLRLAPGRQQPTEQAKIFSIPGKLFFPIRSNLSDLIFFLKKVRVF